MSGHPKKYIFTFSMNTQSVGSAVPFFIFLQHEVQGFPPPRITN
jgi:hypothetical protein